MDVTVSGKRHAVFRHMTAVPCPDVPRCAPITSDVTSVEQLRELLGEPSARVLGKDRAALHDLDRAWLAASPFCLVSTADADGRCDVSPKGDPPGFALVLDDVTIAVPERAGNRRADGFRNILVNPHVGLLFMVPGRGDTLRINGRARLVRDPALLDAMTVHGHRPVMATVVHVEQVFHHCAKAFMRSRLWEPASWDPDAVAQRPAIAHELERREDSIADLQQYYGPGYAAGLYPRT